MNGVMPVREHEMRMKALMGALILLAGFSGCILEEEPRHHGREAVVERDHRHCEGCGHVRVRGVWYDRD
jgi:hypothetical protein